MKRTPVLFLDDIIASISKIEKYVNGMSYTDFKNDDKTIDSVVRNLEIIGEAARNVPDDIRKAYQDIPWSEMIALRNKVTHEYFGIDTQIIWETIHNDLPDVGLRIQMVMASINS
jgi:uncharacterized protein with HEPN domain